MATSDAAFGADAATGAATVGDAVNIDAVNIDEANIDEASIDEANIDAAGVGPGAVANVAAGGEPVSLADFVAGARTLDVVLFSGAGLYARAIRALEGRALGARLAELEARDGALPSHVGVVVRGDAFAPASRYHDPARAYLLESTFGSADVPDFDGRVFAGSQLRELGPAVRHYVAGGGAAWWAPLTPAARAACVAGFDAGGEAASRLHRPYEFSALSLAAAALACCRPCRAACGCAPARWVFCSELAADYLAAAGAFGGAAVAPGDVVPADFLLDADGALPRVVGPPRPISLR